MRPIRRVARAPCQGNNFPPGQGPFTTRYIHSPLQVASVKSSASSTATSASKTTTFSVTLTVCVTERGHRDEPGALQTHSSVTPDDPNTAQAAPGCSVAAINHVLPGTDSSAPLKQFCERKAAFSSHRLNIGASHSAMRMWMRFDAPFDALSNMGCSAGAALALDRTRSARECWPASLNAFQSAPDGSVASRAMSKHDQKAHE